MGSPPTEIHPPDRQNFIHVSQLLVTLATSLHWYNWLRHFLSNDSLETNILELIGLNSKGQTCKWLRVVTTQSMTGYCNGGGATFHKRVEEVTLVIAND